jgi:hypothetical protein
MAKKTFVAILMYVSEIDEKKELFILDISEISSPIDKKPKHVFPVQCRMMLGTIWDSQQSKPLLGVH